MTALRMSAARAEAWHRCPRLHQYRYELGDRAARATRAERLRAVFRAALEMWWRCWHRGEAGLTDALDVIAGAGEQLDAFDRAQLDALMLGYHARWAPAMEAVEVLHVDQQFEASLAGEAGAIDLVGVLAAVVRIDDEVYVVEHKMTSADIGPASAYWAALRLEPHVSIHHDGARALGLEPDGCLYDVVKKPTIRPHKATPEASRRYRKDGALYANQREANETPDEHRVRLVDDMMARPGKYYRRTAVAWFADELAEARRDLSATARLIRASAGQLAPRNPGACFRYGGACEYFDACAGSADLAHDSRLVRRAQKASAA